MILTMTRIAYLPDVTLGRLVSGSINFCTLEEPWIPNKHGPGGQRRGDGQESCVPDGSYTLKPHDGTTFKNVYRLSNPSLGVYDFPNEIQDPKWGRASVLIHAGNTTDDILGCILVGLSFGRLNDKPAVLTSQRALSILREALGRDQHTLVIRPTGGTA